MSIPDSTAKPLTVRDLITLERDNRAAPVIGALSDEQLSELDDRLANVVSEINGARLVAPVRDDIVALAVRVRWTVRYRRAQSQVDALLAWTPR